MNEVQNNYIMATAALKTIEEEEKKFAANYCKEKGYACSRVYALEDKAEFEKATEELAALEKQNGLWDRVCNARENQMAAEEKLLEYALSIIPSQNERDTLRLAVKSDILVRRQVIDLVLRLDTDTVTSTQ